MRAPTGIVLAGGRSTRMGGGDKALLPLGRGTILDAVIGRIAPQVEDLALSANGHPARFAAQGLPVLPDGVPGFAGPLVGILAGLDWAAGLGAERVVSVAADTPFLPCDLVPRLLLAAEQGGPIVLAATGDAPGTRTHPTFGLWPVALREDLRAALGSGTRKVSDWAGRHGTVLARFPVGAVDPFFNVNTPEDLDRARGIVA